jgi:hypothetical protein
MKLCVYLLLLISTTSVFAQETPSSLERKRISSENLKRRQQEEDNYQKSHKNWAYTPGYLAFQEKMINQEFEDDKKLDQQICDKYKGSNCIFVDDSHKQANEREKVYSIGRVKLENQLFHLKQSKKIQESERDRRVDADWLDYLKRECEEFKSKGLCITFEANKKKYKAKYNTEYTATKKQEVNGSGVVDKEHTKTNEALVVKKEEESTQDPLNYKPETCVWSDDIPRKIVTGPDCSKAGSKICVGYVVCEQKEGQGRFVRMSTCSSSNCGELDAADCTKQGGYGSRHPKDEDKETVTNRLKDVMTTPGKVISQ